MQGKFLLTLVERLILLRLFQQAIVNPAVENMADGEWKNKLWKLHKWKNVKYWAKYNDKAEHELKITCVANKR